MAIHEKGTDGFTDQMNVNPAQQPVRTLNQYFSLSNCTHILCAERNREIQTDFGGPLFDEKGHEIDFLIAMDCFCKFSTVCIFDKENGSNVLKFLDSFNEYLGKPPFIRLDRAKCLVGHQVKIFCKRKNFEIIEAPLNNHPAIGLVEGLIQTIKNRVESIKEEKSTTNSFYIKNALKIINHQMRICKQKTTKNSPFKKHIGRNPDTRLSVICTTPKLHNLFFVNITN